MKKYFSFEDVHSINDFILLMGRTGFMGATAVMVKVANIAITALTGNVAVVALNNSVLMIAFSGRIFIIVITLISTVIATMTLIALAGNIAVVIHGGIAFMIAFSGRIFTIAITFIPSLIATITTIALADFSAIAGITGNDSITGLHFSNGIAIMTSCMVIVGIAFIFTIIANISNMLIATIIAIIDIPPIYCHLSHQRFLFRWRF